MQKQPLPAEGCCGLVSLCCGLGPTGGFHAGSVLALQLWLRATQPGWLWVLPLLSIAAEQALTEGMAGPPVQLLLGILCCVQLSRLAGCMAGFPSPPCLSMHDCHKLQTWKIYTKYRNFRGRS